MLPKQNLHVIIIIKLLSYSEVPGRLSTVSRIMAITYSTSQCTDLCSLLIFTHKVPLGDNKKDYSIKNG